MREPQPYSRGTAAEQALSGIVYRQGSRNGLGLRERPDVSTGRRVADLLPEDQHETYKYLDVRILEANEAGEVCVFGAFDGVCVGVVESPSLRLLCSSGWL